MNQHKKTIYIVDDEINILKATRLILEKRGFLTHCFSSAEQCLNHAKTREAHLVITDYKMPSMDGLEFIQKYRTLYPLTPILMITAYGDIPLTVRAFKTGAEDFIEKPLEKQTLTDKVDLLINNTAYLWHESLKKATKTERKILHFILSGLSNKEIASAIGRSVRTVEDHRANIMAKTDCKNIMELLKKIGF